MANDNTILADSISNVPHVSAFDLLWSQRLSAIEVDAVLVYIIDTVAADALPYLAQQFDVSGYKGYVLATTDAERRAIIKQAIELKRYLGTVWAVREAMKSVGYADAVLDEGVDEGDPDTDWAKFRVVVDLGNDKGLDGNTPTELARLISEYKNARSQLLDISYTVSVSDTLPQLLDTFNAEFYQPPIIDPLGYISRFMNGALSMNGAGNMNEGNDYLTISII